MVSFDEGLECAFRVGARSFLETSARTYTNVPSVSQEALRAVLEVKGQVPQVRRVGTLGKTKQRVLVALPRALSRDYTRPPTVPEPTGPAVPPATPALLRAPPPLLVPPSTVFDELLAIFDRADSIGADCVVRCSRDPESRPIHCHRVVLALRSGYFRSLFGAATAADSNNDKLPAEVRLDASHAAVRALLAFCYRPAIERDCPIETLLEMLELNNSTLVVPGAQQELELAIQHSQLQAAPASPATAATSSSSSNSSISDSNKSTNNPLLSSAAAAHEMSPLASSAFEHLCDLVLLVDGQRFLAHRAIVCARCEYFRALLSKQFAEAGRAEVTLNGINRETFALVLRFLYTGRLSFAISDGAGDDQAAVTTETSASPSASSPLPGHVENAQLLLTPEQIIDLLAAANFLSLARLLALCERALESLISHENAAAMWALADRHNARQLRTAVEHVIVTESDRIVKENEWVRAC